MKTSTRIIAITAAAFALGTGGLAFAGHGQGNAGCMGADKGQGMGRHQGGPGGQRGAGNPADVAARLAAAKTTLAITAAQEPAWQAFEGVARQHAEARQAMRSTMQGQAASADHAAQREAMMKQREAHRAESEAARQALYAVLTPEQKAIADKQLGARHGHRMAMHRH